MLDERADARSGRLDGSRERHAERVENGQARRAHGRGGKLVERFRRGVRRELLDHGLSAHFRCTHEPSPLGQIARAGYSTFMKLTIDLSAAQVERLRNEAERLGLTPEDLARAAIVDLLATPDAAFVAAAERVLKKNEELYRRLA